MENDVKRAAEQDDRRELYTLVREHSVDIASLKSGLESLASSTESGFRNISNQIENFGRQVASSRPQVAVIATILISTTALVGALLGFVIKSSVQPLERDTAYNHKSIVRLEAEVTKDLNLVTHPLILRIEEMERRLQNRISDSDDAQNCRIAAIEKITDLVLESSVRDHLDTSHKHQSLP